MRHLTPVLAALLACSSSSSYDPNWGADTSIDGGKADSLLDFAEELLFGQSVTGEVGGDEVDVFLLNAERSDQFTLEVTVTSGDLNPHLLLFANGTYLIEELDVQLGGSSVSKTYKVEDSTRYAVVVRAYQNQGHGRYQVSATCEAGPCNGDPPDAEPLDNWTASECLVDARRCAFDSISSVANDDMTAGELFDLCLFEEGPDCVPACDFDPLATEICEDIVDSIALWADQSTACLQELSYCMSDCYQMEEWTGFDPDDEFEYTPIAICTDNGPFWGSCETWASQLEECGGDGFIHGWQQCVRRCESFVAPWEDDPSYCWEDWCEDECDSAVDFCTPANFDLDAYCEYDCSQVTNEADCLSYCTQNPPDPVECIDETAPDCPYPPGY